VPPATGTPTLIPAGECDDTGDPLCDEPAHLLAFDENEPTLSPGETTTLASEVYNPYLFEVRVLEVALDAQTGGWTITPTFDAEIGLLAPETGREVAWTVTVPDAAAGTYDLTATTRYTAGRRRSVSSWRGVVPLARPDRTHTARWFSRDAVERQAVTGSAAPPVRPPPRSRRGSAGRT
jgi:hypothetical protein